MNIHVYERLNIQTKPFKLSIIIFVSDLYIHDNESFSFFYKRKLLMLYLHVISIFYGQLGIQHCQIFDILSCSNG